MTHADQPEPRPAEDEENGAAAPDHDGSAPADAGPAIHHGDGQVAALEAELARMKDHLLRALADVENTRKRGQREREDAGKFAIASFARDLLGFADNFTRAIAAIPPELKQADERVASVVAGIEAMEKDLLSTFEKHGIQKIEPLDETFDANFHEVIFEAPGTGKPAATIIQVIEPGYILKDRLLRPARVAVAKDEGGERTRIDTQA